MLLFNHMYVTRTNLVHCSPAIKQAIKVRTRHVVALKVHESASHEQASADGIHVDGGNDKDANLRKGWDDI